MLLVFGERFCALVSAVGSCYFPFRAVFSFLLVDVVAGFFVVCAT